MEKEVMQNLMPKVAARKMTREQMKQDFSYMMAQEIILGMLKKGVISEEEFHEISEKNREAFSPYLVELMEKLT